MLWTEYKEVCDSVCRRLLLPWCAIWWKCELKQLFLPLSCFTKDISSQQQKSEVLSSCLLGALGWFLCVHTPLNTHWTLLEHCKKHRGLWEGEE